MALTQGEHVRPILVDPCVYLISSADGPVARDEDIDVVRHALEQPQRGEVVLDRVSGVPVELPAGATSAKSLSGVSSNRFSDSLLSSGVVR